MPNKPAVVYWDSCVFIDRIQRTLGRIELLEEMTDLAAKGGLLIVTSVITIAEVLRGPDSNAADEEHAESIIAYFENEWISLRIVDRMISEEAARLRRKHSFKTADAIHVATAILARVREPALQLHTYDDFMLKRDGKCGSPPLAIIEPKHPEAAPLFDKTTVMDSGDAQSSIDVDTSDERAPSDKTGTLPTTEASRSGGGEPGALES